MSERKPKFRVGQVVALMDDIGGVHGFYRIRDLDAGGVKLESLFYRKAINDIRPLTKREKGEGR